MEYITALKKQTYKEFDILFIDSSPEEHGDFRGKLLKYGGVINIEAGPNINGVLLRAYNEARKYIASNIQYDYAWFLEADQIPQPETLEKLVATKLDVVGAPYLLDANLGVVCVYDYKTEQVLNATDIELMKDGPQQVWGVGHGCVLINRTVLDKIPFRLKKEENIHEALNAAPDTYWYIDLKKAGINVYVLPRLWTKHLRTEDQTPYKKGFIKLEKPTFVKCRNDYWGNGQEPKFFIMKGQVKRLPDYIDEITKYALDTGLLIEVEKYDSN